MKSSKNLPTDETGTQREARRRQVKRQEKMLIERERESTTHIVTHIYELVN